MSLPTNYQNEILNSQMSNRRQYRMIENNNGTYSFIDVTVYDQEGSLFDADDINDICTAINLNITNIETVQSAIEAGVVNGIKGSAESDYRVGMVTLSAANVNAYTKAQVDDLVAQMSGMGFKLVDSLPTTNISPSIIYLVPSSEYTLLSAFTAEVVEELPIHGDETVLYILENEQTVSMCTDTSDWEQIGSTSVDLTNYYTKTEINTGSTISVAEFQALQ